ncbi:toxin [Pseudomonas syringae]|nr:toxin [Pseudomonas syringae]MCF5071414.1 toxin [Pseudomonas syringae]
MTLHHKTPALTATDPRGLAIRTIAYWRCVESAPVESRVERSVHDAAGRVVEHWDARLWALQASDPQTPANLRSVYSLTGQVVQTVSVDAGTQIELRGPGAEILWGWDSREIAREVAHDVLVRPIAIFEAGAGEPRQCVERLTYGRPGAGDPLHNQLGQLIRHDDPAGSLLLDGFSLNAQCTESTRHFTLDPVMPDWPEAVVDRQRLLEPGPGASSRWRFGALGHVLEQSDARGNRHAFRLTVEGRTQASRLLLRGQTVEQWLVGDIAYDADGHVEFERAGNGVRTRLAYRPEDGRLMARHTEDANGRILQHLLYGYDPMGNVLSIEDQAQPIRYFANQRIDPIRQFGYDSLYQLIEASGWEAGTPFQGPESVSRSNPAAVSNYRQTYHYDVAGNLLELVHVGAQQHGHRMKAARYNNRCLPYRNGLPPTEEEIAAGFDARGNLLILDPGRQLLWNLRNQLQSVSPVERDQEVCLYDGAGQRVRKIRSLRTRARTVVADVRYLPGLELRTHNGTGEILEVVIGQTSLNSVRLLHWESPPPSGINDRYRYAHTDHLGSVCLELTADARIISDEHFYPFGETAILAGADTVEVSYKVVRYSGKERDATGLYYYGYRFYIPWLQRWVNADPNGFIDGPNLFRMVGNSPIGHVDRDGGVKVDASALTDSVSKQQTLLSTVDRTASDMRDALLNHVYPQQRFRALARRVTTQLVGNSIIAGGKALGGAGGSAVGGLFGPAGVATGAMIGQHLGEKAADSLVSRVIDTYRLDRAINFKGTEMNPKALVESVEPKKSMSLTTLGHDLSAYDPRHPEGRSLLVGKVGKALADKAVEKVADKLGAQAPGLIKTGVEFYRARRGLNATALSEAFEQTPVVIDMLEFRMQAIALEFAGSGAMDPQVFEDIAQLSLQTPSVIEKLKRNQDTVALVAPTPYAGRHQSLRARTRATAPRQVSMG